MVGSPHTSKHIRTKVLCAKPHSKNAGVPGSAASCEDEKLLSGRMITDFRVDMNGWIAMIVYSLFSTLLFWET